MSRRPAAAVLAAALALLALPRLAAAAAPWPELAAAVASEAWLNYKLELAGVVAVITYIVLGLRGSAANRRLVDAWASVLAGPGSVMARNFEASLPAWRESAADYRSYSSGRRYCSGATLVYDLRARQDVFAQLWYLLSPKDDELTLEVAMHEAAMPPTVIVLGQAKAVKALLKQEPKLSSFAKPLQLSRDRASGWSPDSLKGLAFAAEQPSLLYELLNTEPAIAKALSLKWLRYAVLSSEDTADRRRRGSDGDGDAGDGQAGDAAEGQPGPRLRFVFSLPPLQRADELSQLLAAAFLLVDLLGSYKVSPEMKKRAQDLRTRLEQEAAKKESQSRQGQLQLKRMERLEAERAKARAAGPQALAKFEEKMQRTMRNREMRKRTIRA